VKLLDSGISSPSRTYKSPREQDQQNRSKTEIPNVTVFGRFNRQVPVYTKFESQPYTKVHSLERMQAMTVGDGIIDPHQTISKYNDPMAREKIREPNLYVGKDPGYHELNKRSTRAHDFGSKVINDNQARLYVKVDERYGMQNGGLYG